MSLLMNALKKAETAKAAGEAELARTTTAPASAGAAKRDLTEELGLDPQPLTRSSTSNRSRTYNSEPFSPPQPAAAPALGLALELEPETAAPVISPANEAQASKRTAPGSPAQQGSAAASAQAVRNVFGAKKPAKGNSRTPFYALVGLCLLAGGGYAAYIWQQMQPPSQASLAARNIAPPAPVPPPQLPALPADSPQDAMPDKEPLIGAAQIDPAAPGAGRVAVTADRPDRPFSFPADAPMRGVATLQRGREFNPLLRDSARAEGGTAVDSPANLRISRTTAPATVNSDVAAGYAALRGGDLDGSTQAYERALRTDPANRDALLGIATIQLRLNRTDAAEASFRRVMRLYPQDTYAAAQLAALQAGSDPVGALSQVNSLIAREADRADAGNGALPFIQGNQLAAQGRWNEAQQAYFNAHRADPGNPDYSYNLAVSLDRIHELRLARDYYAKALELARSRPAGFDTTRAQTRLGQLEPASR